MKLTTVNYQWTHLLFPLHLSKRPKFEAFEFVDKVLSEARCDPRRSEESRSGDQQHDGWLRWHLARGLSEDDRQKIQMAFEANFGEDVAREFSWSGVMFSLVSNDVRAVGRYIQ